MIKPLKLYITNKTYSSWSLRAWLLMRELAIPFEEVLMPLEDGGNDQNFRRFCPTGTVPCLHDGDRVVWDSLGITEYLAELHPGVWPVDFRARAWARCAAAEMHSGFQHLRNACSMHCTVRVRLHAVSDVLQRDLDRIDALWCDGLARHGGPFLAGAKFCAVDAFYAPVAVRLQTFQLALSAPAMAYARRLLELPAMRAWFEAALAERARDPGHDADTLGAGTLVEDFRARP